jgi:hypothetical protein
MKKPTALCPRFGDDLDFYFNNRGQAIWGIVMEQIRDDIGARATDEECEAELRRLCEPSVRHYADCMCAICK